MKIDFSRLSRFLSLKHWENKKKLFTKHRILKFALYTTITVVGLYTLFILFIYIGLFGKLPAKNELKSIQHPIASEVYSADSVLMGKYYIQNRQDLKSYEIPTILKEALIATEDIRFYNHSGIDLRSLARVAVKTILLRHESSGGGSTITQQLAKNLFPRKEYHFLTMPINKFREMLTAFRIEHVYTKEEILELYLNTVPFGENTYGIKSASLRYFNKNPQFLSIEEAAVLVGMLKATNYYNPHTNYDNALRRRNVVLAQMTKYGYCTPENKDSIQKLSIKLDYVPLSHNSGIAPYFREFLRQEVEKWCEKNLINENGENTCNLYTDGLKIYTTIDSRLQNYAEKAMKEHMAYVQDIFDKQWANRDIWKRNPEIEKILLKQISKENYSDEPVNREVFSWKGMSEKKLTSIDSLKYYLQFLQTGFLAMDVQTAEIKAWIGGINHKYFQYDHVLAKRQVGSTFKPLVYLSALEDGILPCDFFPNDSIVYEEYDNWLPQNADHKYGGFYSLKGALTHSVNTVSVSILLKTGFKKVISIAKKAGIESEIPEVPSLALGTADISLLEMVNAYQALANKGEYIKRKYISRIEDKNGNILYLAENKSEGEQIADEKNIEMLVEMMKNVVNNGTAASLRSKYHLYTDIAGKTGTTQNHTDGWFIGFTPSIVAGVWVGGDYQNIRFESLKYGQGAFTALPIWAKFMKSVYEDETYSYLKKDTFKISEETKQMFSCEDFREETPLEFKPLKKLREIHLFKRLFKKKKKQKELEQDN